MMTILTLCLAFQVCWIFVSSNIVSVSKMRTCKRMHDGEDFSFMDDCRDENSTCGIPEVKPSLLGVTRIVGGNISRPYSWPWQVSLQYMSSSADWRHLCGSSIIDPCYVVTAAHCVEDFTAQPYNLRVVAGVFNIKEEEGSVHNVTRIYVHPQFKGAITQWDNDIAVLKLVPPIVFGKHISKICIPGKFPVNKSSGVATGWGHTTDGGKLSDVLRQVELPVISWRDCKLIYPTVINQNKFCAGYLLEGGRDTCQGDSGGPLVTRSKMRYWLTGITSVGSNCAIPKKPGVYTNVAAYKSWLLKFIKDKNECRSKATNRCEHICLNTPGSYKCACCDGYILTEERNCFVECGRPEEMPMIMDRNDVLNVTDPLSHPWMVSLRMKELPDEHLCPAVIVAENWVLANPLCLLNENQTVLEADQIFALAGSPKDSRNDHYSYETYPNYIEYDSYGYDLDCENETDDCVMSYIPPKTPIPIEDGEFEQKMTFTKIKVHERFDPTGQARKKTDGTLDSSVAEKDYALALLYTSQPVTFSHSVRPICISLEQLQDDDLCLVPGWRGSSKMTQKQVLTATRETCETHTLQNLTKRMVCAGNNHEWVERCDEDLGSPLVCISNEKMVVSGISLGRCINPRSMATYIQVSFFNQWMVDIINGKL